MAFNFDFLTYRYNSNVMTGRLIINKSEFETGKNEYTMKVTAHNSNGGNTATIKIASNNGNMPSVIIGGEANSSRPWGCPFFGSWGSLTTYTSWTSNMNGNNFRVTSVTLATSDDTFSFTAEGWNRSLVNGGNISNGQITISIEADFPLFIGTPTRIGSDDNYVQYMPASNTAFNTYITEISNNNDLTNINKAVNYINVVDSIPSDQSYFIDSTLKVNGHITSQKAYSFQIQPNSKIVLYQDETATGDASPNLHLIISNYPVLLKRRSEPDSAYSESSNVDTEYWHQGYWKDLDTGVNYTGICSTNIPIFRGSEAAQKYLDGELDISDAINGGALSNKDSTIGEDLSSSDIDTVNLATSGVGCYIYALSEAQIKDLMQNYLYVTDQTKIDAIRDGIWYWGNNPIDFFIDCYYIPFGIDNFYDTVSANMKFGTYQFPNSSFPAVKESNGDRIVLFDTTFEGVYGDWRDYTQFKYDLYLPFYGFFPLDLFKYLNHNVRCEMMFDITTHNIRYYLFVDGIITDRIDSSVGINLPLMASDYVNKAKSDRQTERAMEQKTVNMTLQAAKNGMDIGGAIVSGNTVAAVNNGISAVGNVANSMYDLAALSDKAKENSSQSIHGSFSSAMNIYDIKYAYLRITEDQMILPEKIHELYNYPSYYVGSASALSGYCEISDIRLKSFTGTVEEANALKSALMEGIIL